MGFDRRLSAVFCCALALLAVLAAPAGADSFLKVFDYYRAHAGKIPPCVFSAKELQSAEHGSTNDLNQYGPDFAAAVQAALLARTKGACAKKASSTKAATNAAAAPASSTPAAAAGTPAAAAPATAAAPTAATGATGATAAPAAATPQPAPTPVAAPAAADNAINAAAASAPHSSGGKDAPAPLIILAVLIGLLLLAALGLGVLRAGGADPPWLERWRHATAEAGWRTAAAWAEFTDWVRLGR